MLQKAKRDFVRGKKILANPTAPERLPCRVRRGNLKGAMEKLQRHPAASVCVDCR